MEDKKSKKVIIIIDIIVILFLIGISIFLFVHYYDDFKLLKTDEGVAQFVEKVHNAGFGGVLLLMLIQIFQVVVAFIPGEFVELSSGMLFGPFWGLIICLIGLNIGTMVIFGLVKLLGKPFVSQSIGKNSKTPKLDFLKEPNRALIILFFIFLVPGIPKDILIYPIPLTKIKMWKFMIVSSIARIPSILSSTFVGAAILEKNYVTAGIIFVVFLLLAILGLIFNKKIYEWVEKISKKENITI